MSAKYFKRGIREYYMVSDSKTMMVINYEFHSQVTIWGDLKGQRQAFVEANVKEGQEITREEFKAQFEIASRLIVLEP